MVLRTFCAPDLFALFLLGLIMLIFSIVAGVGFFEFQTPAGQSKQVGYIWALNWSFMFLLGFPIMFFFILETSDSLRRTLERLVEDGMIVDMNWHPAGVGALDDERNRFWRLSACAAIFVTICIVPYCLIEWYIVSGRHLFANQLPAVVLQGPRRGFSVFERLFKRILLATLVGFLLCYFMNN